MAHIVQINNCEVIRLPLGRRQIPPQPPVRSVFAEAQSWSAPSESDDGLLATLLRLDRRSLFTGSTADLEVAYLIPPDPTDASEVAHVVSLKCFTVISVDGSGIISVNGLGILSADGLGILSADGLRLLRKRSAIASNLGETMENFDCTAS